MLDEEAKATQEVAKFGTKALDSGDKLGTFLSKVFGTVPSDAVGVLGGDWLHHVRVRNAVKLAQRTEEILRARGVTSEPMSPSVAIPILTAGQDETRDELRELWARLLANGMDPARTHLVRTSIIEAVKSFDPLDAMILIGASELSDLKGNPVDLKMDQLKVDLKATYNEFELSIANLGRLKCIYIAGMTGKATSSIRILLLGWEVIRSTRL